MEKDQYNEHLLEYVASKGITFNRQGFTTCINPEHDDSTPSMSFDDKRNKLHCFGCSADYGLIDAIQILDLGIPPTPNRDDFLKAKYIADKVFSIAPTTRPIENKKHNMADKENKALIAARENIDTYKDDIANTDYLRNRGISDTTAKEHDVTYVDQQAAVYFKNSKGNFTIRYLYPVDNQRYRNLGDAGLFNIADLDKPELFITEGEIDALSFLEVNQNAVGLGSTSNVNILLDAVKDKETKPIIYLCLDNDTAGNIATNKLLTSLSNLSINAYDVRELIYTNEVKDPNEQLTTDRDAFKTAATNISSKILQASSVSSDLDRFTNKIIDSKDYKTISTGFNKLDELLNGGFRAGLYFLGAISSLGKTTLLMQIADQIARQGTDVLVFSLEMSKDELYSKSISRITAETVLDNEQKYTLRDAKTVLGVLEGNRYAKYSTKEKELIINSTDDYFSNIGKHLYIYEGVGDIGAAEIRQLVKRHATLSKEPPVVIIDYLQILAPYNERYTDKQNTDKSVLELKRIARDLQCPVFAISSFNRDNYKNKVNMASFKESGAIEYSSDVLIGLEFTAMTDNADADIIDEERSKDTREVTLKVLKNRSGRTGVKARCDFSYYPKFNLYIEK